MVRELELRSSTGFTPRMKWWMTMPLVAGLFGSGCVSPKEPAQSSASAQESLLVTPARFVTGKVVTYTEAGRFTVLDFPPGRVPVLDQRLFVYRDGLKVGEVKITGPRRDNNIVADLISGEVRAGDEVRDR